MIQRKSNHFYQSSLLASVPGINHGYSSRLLGDMRNRGQRKLALRKLGFSENDYIEARQVHSDKVVLATIQDRGKIIESVDGLIYKKTYGYPVMLGILSADCVPVILVDPQASLIAAVHAGWRGTLDEILIKAIGVMRDLGAKSERILASIGPAIGPCCYEVSHEIAKRFQNNYGDSVASLNLMGRYHLNLKQANRMQLLSQNIDSKHIDISKDCTACRIDEFYSYRIDTKETFGEMVSLIGYNKHG